MLLEERTLSGPDGARASVLALTGHIDARNVDELRGILDAVIEAGGCNVVLDCEHLDYINSTGLGLVIEYLDRLESLGGMLVLSRLSDKALTVVEMLGFGPALNMANGDAEAAALFWPGEK